MQKHNAVTVAFVLNALLKGLHSTKILTTNNSYCYKQNFINKITGVE